MSVPGCFGNFPMGPLNSPPAARGGWEEERNPSEIHMYCIWEPGRPGAPEGSFYISVLFSVQGRLCHPVLVTLSCYHRRGSSNKQCPLNGASRRGDGEELHILKFWCSALFTASPLRQMWDGSFSISPGNSWCTRPSTKGSTLFFIILTKEIIPDSGSAWYPNIISTFEAAVAFSAEAPLAILHFQLGNHPLE